MIHPGMHGVMAWPLSYLDPGMTVLLVLEEIAHPSPRSPNPSRSNGDSPLGPLGANFVLKTAALLGHWPAIYLRNNRTRTSA